MDRANTVNWRGVKYALEIAGRAGLDRASLVAGLPFDETSLPRHKWIRWDDYCTVLERLQDLCGGPDALQRIALEQDGISDVRQLARAFISPLQLFRFIFQVVDPIAFPSLEFELEVSSPRQVRVTCTIPAGSRSCAALGHSSVGSIRAITTYLGLPPSEIEASIGDHRSVYLVTLPESQTIVARSVRQARAAIEAMVAYSTELTTDLLQVQAQPDLDERVRLAQGAHELTPRQAEVVSHLVQGRSNKEIAATLGCAENTVELHLSEAFRKFGCSSRAQLIAKFWSAA